MGYQRIRTMCVALSLVIELEVDLSVSIPSGLLLLRLRLLALQSVDHGKLRFRLVRLQIVSLLQSVHHAVLHR